MFGIGEKFWQSSNYEIGLPHNATEPFNWRRAAYEHAFKVTPDQAAREKLQADNAHWLDRDRDAEEAERMN
jgi:hypothetical protein